MRYLLIILLTYSFCAYADDQAPSTVCCDTEADIVKNIAKLRDAGAPRQKVINTIHRTVPYYEARVRMESITHAIYLNREIPPEYFYQSTLHSCLHRSTPLPE